MKLNNKKLKYIINQKKKGRASAIFMLTTISAYFVYTEMAVLLFVFGAGYGM